MDSETYANVIVEGNIMRGIGEYGHNVNIQLDTVAVRNGGLHVEVWY